MPKPAFFRLLPPAERAALDTEIRQRGYADLEGIVGWLSARGVLIQKSAVWNYVRRLRVADESRVSIEFSKETKAAILECAALVIRLFNTLHRIDVAAKLQGIMDEREPDPE